MSTAANSVNLQTGTGNTTAFHNHLRSASGQWHRYNDTTDTHGYYSGVGSPEGVVAADIGSIYTDTGAGASGVYYKTSDVANTGWELIPSSTTGSAFFASLTTGASNVTGAGASYTLSNASGGVLTEVYDVNGDFTPATGTFTAPVTGRYYFHVRFSLDQVGALNTAAACTISAAGSLTQVIQGGILNAGAIRDSGNQLGVLEASGTLSLAAGDTVTATVASSGGGGNTIDILSQALNVYFTYFEGHLIASGTPLNGQLSVVNQTFTANGTYTPTAGMVYCEVEMVGGGGSGGGAVATGAASFSVGGGGAAGEYSYGVFSAATIGVSQAVTIGAAGAPAVGATGGAGGTTSLGALISSGGGSGGAVSAAGINVSANGGVGGTGGAGGSLRYNGDRGFWGYAVTSIGLLYSGQGASDSFGAGGYPALFPVTTASGSVGTGFGTGGSGAANNITQAAVAGSSGAAGVMQITEYVVV